MGAPVSRLEGKPSGGFEDRASHVPDAMAVSSTSKTRCLGPCRDGNQSYEQPEEGAANIKGRGPSCRDDPIGQNKL